MARFGGREQSGNGATSGFTLKIELVPSPLWRKTLANLARNNSAWRSKWQTIRSTEMKRTGGKCACGAQAHSLHEVWEYDDREHVQRLAGFETVCSDCSLAQHIGRAFQIGKGEEALKHIMKVNGITYTAANELVEKAKIVWEIRSSYEWRQDLGWLRSRVGAFGITLEDVDLAEEVIRGLSSDY